MNYQSPMSLDQWRRIIEKYEVKLRNRMYFCVIDRVQYIPVSRELLAAHRFKHYYNTSIIAHCPLDLNWFKHLAEVNICNIMTCDIFVSRIWIFSTMMKTKYILFNLSITIDWRFIYVCMCKEHVWIEVSCVTVIWVLVG